MSSAPKPATEDATSFPIGVLLRNPWVLLLLGASGGGGLGTLLGRPILAAEVSGVSKDDVQQIVDTAISKNNDVLLQRIELIMARDKLRGAGLSSPALAGPPPPP